MKVVGGQWSMVSGLRKVICVSLIFNFYFSFFNSLRAQEVVEDTVMTVKVPKGLIDDMLTTNERLQLPVAVVRFSEDNDELDNRALRQLNLMVPQIQAAKEGAEFYIIATADDADESQRHNRKLCRHRCEAVYKALTEVFSVDKNRLRMLPDGGFSEYEHQHSERMVLIIQRTPETQDVIERWISEEWRR